MLICVKSTIFYGRQSRPRHPQNEKRSLPPLLPIAYPLTPGAIFSTRESPPCCQIHQPAQKWLKDRKGRVLTVDDIKHYQRIVVALEKTAEACARLG